MWFQVWWSTWLTLVIFYLLWGWWGFLGPYIPQDSSPKIHNISKKLRERERLYEHVKVVTCAQSAHSWDWIYALCSQPLPSCHAEKIMCWSVEPFRAHYNANLILIFECSAFASVYVWLLLYFFLHSYPNGSMHEFHTNHTRISQESVHFHRKNTRTWKNSHVPNIS